MNPHEIITCECHLHGGRPVACCGDFVCPLLQGKSSPSSDRGCPEDELNVAVPKSRVRAIRQLFEDKIQVDRANSSRVDRQTTIRPRRSVTSSPSLETLQQPLVEEDPQIYRSRTQITHIPNGVKITTTILAGENLDLVDECGRGSLPPPVGEGPSVYETLMYPESEIIKRFEMELKRAGR